MNIKEESTPSQALTELLQIVAELRNPNTGCPWDIKQSHDSLIPFVLEEAHEVADAIRHGDDADLKEELGDLLLQVILHSQIASEKKHFDFTDVVKNLSNKLIRRHPHVFQKDYVENNQNNATAWDEIKIAEQPLANSRNPFSERLKRKARSQSGINGALVISKKVREIGLEWESIDLIWSKVDEEINELKQELSHENLINAQEELGDLLFTLINLAHWYGLSPEEGLQSTNKKFIDRVSYIEIALKSDFIGASRQQIKKLWHAAKHYFSQEKTEYRHTFKSIN